MSLFTKKKILVTHSSTFHADDIFATAALRIMFDGNVTVIRSREPEMFKKGDFVYDVGGEYDPSRNRFDHHQHGGAGARPNGIPYAAFGLVWKSYGARIAGSQEIADKIDEDLVQPIDAHDNGMDMYTLLRHDLSPYLIENMFSAFRPTWTEEQDYDAPFMVCVGIAETFLRRAIIRARDSILGKKFIEKAYSDASDKRIIILDGTYSWQKILHAHPEPLYVIFPKSGKWSVVCVRKDDKSFENRKSFPESWAGLMDEELAKVSGVPDATFCHNARFLAVARSKDGAIALANKALLA